MDVFLSLQIITESAIRRYAAMALRREASNAITEGITGHAPKPAVPAAQQTIVILAPA